MQTCSSKSYDNYKPMSHMSSNPRVDPGKLRLVSGSNCLGSTNDYVCQEITFSQTSKEVYPRDADNAKIAANADIPDNADNADNAGNADVSAIKPDLPTTVRRRRPCTERFH